MVGCKPLIAWTIEAALGAESVTRTIVTTDDEEIASVSRASGADVPFIRPAELARDETAGIEPILHAVRWLAEHQHYRPQVVISLQPTSPLRASSDIDAALDLLEARRADAVVSVTPVRQHPYWMKRLDDSGFIHDFLRQQTPIGRRQELPPVYALNGAIYLARREFLLERESWYGGRTAGYVMPLERSVDIDTAWDVRVAELLLAGGTQ